MTGETKNAFLFENVLRTVKKRNATKTQRNGKRNEKRVLGQIKRRYHCILLKKTKD